MEIVNIEAGAFMEMNDILTIALNRYHCSAAIGTVMTLQTVPHSVL